MIRSRESKKKNGVNRCAIAGTSRKRAPRLVQSLFTWLVPSLAPESVCTVACTHSAHSWRTPSALSVAWMYATLPYCTTRTYKASDRGKALGLSSSPCSFLIGTPMLLSCAHWLFSADAAQDRIAPKRIIASATQDWVAPNRYDGSNWYSSAMMTLVPCNLSFGGVMLVL